MSCWYLQEARQLNLLQAVEVVEVGKSREELVGTAHPVRVSDWPASLRSSEMCSLETNDDPPFPALLDLKHLNHGSTPPLDLIHDFLVDVDGVI